MAEDGGDGEAIVALDVHEVGVWRLHKTLELMRAFLCLWAGVQQVNGQWHFQFWKEVIASCLEKRKGWLG